MKYQIKPGDSLIKIARQFGLNSIDEILQMNPQIKDANLIYSGQTINLPDKEYFDNINASTVTAEMLPDVKQKQIAAYAQAVRDHKIKINQIPERYRSDVYKESIRQSTNAAAPVVLSKIMLSPMTIPDVLIRGGLNEIRKAVNGKDDTDDYGIHDYFSGNFSWLGRDFEEQHPVADAIVNTVTTPVIMVGGEAAAARAIDAGPGAVSRMMTNARNNATATAEAIGVRRIAPASTSRGALSAEEWARISNANRSSGFSSSDVGTMAGKGSGKTGTVRASGSHNYRSNSSRKGTTGHRAGGAPKQQKVVLTQTTITPPDIVGGFNPWHGANVPIFSSSTTPYVVVNPQNEEEHYEAKWENLNPWIYNTSASTVVPYEKGAERISHNEGKAAKTGAQKERITKEALKENIPGRGNEILVMPGSWFGQPSQYYIQNGQVYKDKFGGILKRK